MASLAATEDAFDNKVVGGPGDPEALQCFYLVDPMAVDYGELGTAYFGGELRVGKS
jgi:hypothetical protein